MQSSASSLESILAAAVEIPSAVERATFVEQACAGDSELKRRVEQMIENHFRAGSFLEAPIAAAAATIEQPTLEHAGTQIGPYKLMEQIGEGGMGLVFVAEQHEPVRRKVALKLIKPGMDTRDVIARFEAERQALALMDHPNIARVLDAGATATGRPYFVMELVKGVPITQYCDENRLAPRERLDLFTHVCHAVQHAHQKGIIHRDIKPTNVLVASHDGKPVVKVIDFGVAKAIGQQLTERTIYTAVSQMVGTPLYMSPEQAGLSSLDIDTRTDIYSLGVLLYELLTGTTPFDKERLRQAAYEEMRRIIREEEPQKPSTRISTTDAAPSIAAQRNTEPAKLSRLVRGELDWIVMKALDKDRNRRYETPNGLAADVLRYLHDEHVLACPPSTGYRMRKFARRNKAALATSAVVLTALVLGTTVSVWQAVRATAALQAEERARREAELARDGEAKQRKVAQENAAEAEDQRQRAEENFQKARQAVDEYLSQITENELLSVPGLQPLREDLLQAALKFYAEFTQERADDPTLQRELASAHYRLAKIQSDLRNTAAARAANLEAIRLFEQLRDQGPMQIDLQAGLASAYFFGGRYDDTVKLCQAALEAHPEHAEVRSLLADTYNQLGVADSDKNNIAGALTRHRQAFELREALVSDFPDNPRYLAQLGGTVNNLGILLSKQGKPGEALAMFERAVEYSAQAYERTPHSILWGRWLCQGLRNVAGKQAALGKQEEALRSYERLVTVSRKRAFENPAIGSLRADLYRAYLELGKHQNHLGDAAAAGRSFRLAREVLEQIPRETREQLYDLATVYAGLANPAVESTEPSASDAAELQRNAELAIQALNKAVDAGFQNASLLETNKAFDALRGRDDFQTLLATIHKIAEADRLAKVEDKDAAKKLTSRQQAADLLKGLASAQPGQVRHRATLAATLHSIGVLQTGLKQFDEAEKSLAEALKLRRELLEAPAKRPQARLDVLTTRAALGQLYWESDRPQDAHRLWQDMLPQLALAAADHPEDTTLQAGIAGIVLAIGQRYGEIGLWELAGHPVDQSLKTGQLFNVYWDCRGAHVLAALGRLEEHRRFCQLIADKWGKKDPAHVVWAATMNPQPALEVKQLLELAEAVINSSADPLAKFQVATAYYRTGEYERALESMLPFREKTATGGSAYLHWYALVYNKLGQQQEAARYFEQAEAKYLRFAERCLQSPTKSAVKDGHGGYWYAMAEDQAVRQVAWNELHGEGSLSDSWQHLIQARAYRLLGEHEKSAAELAAADASTPTDPQIWKARIGLATHVEDAEKAWQRVLELAGDDPLPWIERARWFAERGEHAKADADLAKAASLTPNELNKFVEAGWWVVGPYSKELKEFCPPELDPDPSQPLPSVKASAPATTSPESPLTWRQVTPSRLGQVNLLQQFPRAADQCCYLLTYVGSRDARAMDLVVGGDGPRRVWLNGELVHESTIVPRNSFNVIGAPRAKLALRAGRNTLLVKASIVQGKGAFNAQLSDSLVLRAIEISEQRRFAEAVPLWNQLCDQVDDFYVYRCTALCAAAAGDDASYQRAYEKFVSRHGSTEDPHGCHSFLFAFGVKEHAMADRVQWDRMVEAVRNQKMSMWGESASLGDYRAGRFPRALETLLEGDAEKSPHRWPLIALVQHALGNETEARAWLEKADGWRDSREADTYNSRLPRYHNTATLGPYFETLYREAATKIRGSVPPRDMVGSHVLAAQAQTIAGDFRQADAEFAKAIELDPQRIESWIARGRWYAQRGQHQKADADFAKAATLTPEELNKFIEAGWWAATTAEGLSALFPQQMANPPAESSAPTFTVVGVAPYAQQVGFREVTQFIDASAAHAMTYVYAPEAKAVTLLVGGATPAELRLNGKPVYQWKSGLSPYHAERVPVFLRRGRNTLVARVSSPGRADSFLLRIGDNRVDRGLELGRLGLWEEALDLLKAELADGQRLHPHVWSQYARLLAATGDSAGFREFCQQVLKWIGDKPDWDTHLHASEICSLAPVPELDVSRLVPLVEEIGAKAQHPAWALNLKWRLYFRAGRYQDVLDGMETPGMQRATLRALCWHHLGDRDKARSELARAERGFADLFRLGPEGPSSARVFNYTHFLLDLAYDYVMLREARTLIAPDSSPDDQAFHSLLAQVRQQFQAADPRLLPFEVALISDGKNPERWLQRGRARAELGQWELAESDFAKAVAMAPNDLDVLVSRSLIHAELNRVEEASAELVKFLDQEAASAKAPGWLAAQQRLYQDLGQWPELFERVTRLRPDDPGPWIARVRYHLTRGRWPDPAGSGSQVRDQRADLDKAMADLREAVARGFRDLNQPKTDADWQMLQSREDFKELLREAAERSLDDLVLLAKLNGHTDMVRAVAFLPDGRRIVSVGRDKMMRIWDAESRSVLSTLPVESYNMRDADVSADGRLVTVVSSAWRPGGDHQKAVVQVWDLEKGESVRELVQDFKWTNCIRFSPDGTRVVTSGAPPQGVLWDVPTGKELRRLDLGVTSDTQAAAFSPDGRLLALGAVGRVRLFDVESGDLVGDVRLPNNRSTSDLVFTPNGETLASGQLGGHVNLIDVGARRVIKTLPSFDDAIRKLRFLNNDRFLLTASLATSDATLQVWDVGREMAVAKATTATGTNERISISADGRYAVTAGGGVWDNETSKWKATGDYALRLWRLPRSVWTIEPAQRDE